MVAKNYADAFNALLDAYLKIGDNIPQLSQYQQLFETNPHMQLALASIYEDILEFHKEALRYFRQRSMPAICSHVPLQLIDDQHGESYFMRHGALSAIL